MQRATFIYSVLALGFCLLASVVGPELWQRVQAAVQSDSDSGQRYNLTPILCYHNVDGPGPYSVTREEFRQQMELIRTRGIRVIPLAELVEAAKENRLLREPSIVITIDDDYENIARVAAPILREYRYPATFFFYIEDIMGDPRWGASWDDLRRLHAEGFDIQNHSWTHGKFHRPHPGEPPELWEKRVHKEIVLSREVLEKNIPGLKITAFAYPMGYHSPALRRRLLNEGYDILLTTDARPVDLSRPFRKTFDRYTIQKFFVRNPEAMFQRQLEYALTPYSEGQDRSQVVQGDAVDAANPAAN